LGSEEFVATARARLLSTGDPREIPRREKFAGRPSLAQLFECGGGKARDQAIAVAYVSHGYQMKEIADYLGVHYATISRAIRREERENV
jgi:DNA-binding NarL/FixJ family response regulator